MRLIDALKASVSQRATARVTGPNPTTIRDGDDLQGRPRIEDAGSTPGAVPFKQEPVSNVGRDAPRVMASRRERKLASPKQRIAELEETVALFGAAVMEIRARVEEQTGRPLARNLLPKG